VIEKVKGLCNNFVNLGVALASRLGVWRSEKPPNKACSRLVGLAATYKPFSGFEFFLLSSRIPARPPAANANRSAAVGASTLHNLIQG